MSVERGEIAGNIISCKQEISFAASLYNLFLFHLHGAYTLFPAFDVIWNKIRDGIVKPRTLIRRSTDDRLIISAFTRRADRREKLFV